MAVLSGGEPTVRDDLLELARHARGLGLQFGLVTNARMLAYPDLCRKLLALGLGYVYQSLAGPDPASHDAAVRAPGAFEQSLRALANLQAAPVERTVNAVVTRQNLERLEEFAPLVAPFAPLRLKFSLVEPEGNALEDFAALVPALPEAATRVWAAVERARALPGLALAVDGFPACLMPELEVLDAGLRADGFAWMAEAFEDRFHPVDDRNRGHGERCSACSLRRRCRGVFATYLASRGEHELRPTTRPVPNSFNLAPEGPGESLRLSACPIRVGHRPPPEPVRACLVAEAPGRARRYRVRGEDFSDQTLELALRQREQVYEDLSSGVVLDDFGAQLRRLTLAAACRRCPRRPLCGGCFRPVRGTGFARARRVLEGWLRRVRGRILDIGCGQIPVRPAFTRALREGTLDYLGLDPHLPEDASDLPGLPRRRLAFEDLRPTGGRPFDWVLALRSLNHLKAPRDALARIARLLSPGTGKLVLAEDVVFGLVRRAGKVAAVEARQDLPFDHRFNVELEEAEAWGQESGLRILARHTPAELGCTLWILVLGR
jgi:MoaA/NifB/PqqE/SkfB family radical SAM enzyme